jgi:signal transduction histidine kinase
MSTLLSTLRSLPDDERVAAERELIPLARAAALGELAADVAHDVANPLFGVLGLVELLLEDAPAGSADEARLRLLAKTALEMKGIVRTLLDFARGEESTEHASLPDATRQAIALLRHGVGRTLEIDERYETDEATVPCPRGLLVQAVLQLLVAARETGRLAVAVGDGLLELSPPPAESLGTLVALRIAVDHGAATERTAGSLRLHWLR